MNQVIALIGAPNKNSNPSAATAAAYAAYAAAFQNANSTIAPLLAAYQNAVAADTVTAAEAAVVTPPTTGN